MEGLIPLVYRAIKKNKTRRQYKCLSMTTATTTTTHHYNIADFYTADSLTHQLPYLSTPQPPQPEKMAGQQGSDMGHHRRYRSVDEFSGGGGGFYLSPEKPRVVEMRRFKSHRGMLSCISGG